MEPALLEHKGRPVTSACKVAQRPWVLPDPAGDGRSSTFRLAQVSPGVRFSDLVWFASADGSFALRDHPGVTVAEDAVAVHLDINPAVVERVTFRFDGPRRVLLVESSAPFDRWAG